jgi:hypothetical protein
MNLCELVELQFAQRVELFEIDGKELADIRKRDRRDGELRDGAGEGVFRKCAASRGLRLPRRTPRARTRF